MQELYELIESLTDEQRAEVINYLKNKYKRKNKFEVVLIKEYSKKVVILATDEQEACDIATSLYEDELVELEGDDYVSTIVL